MVHNMVTIFTIFGQNSAEFYDNRILLTMIFMFLSETVLKSRNLALYSTENEKKVLKQCFPLDTRSPSHCSFIS